jgi:hypothetical protein
MGEFSKLSASNQLYKEYVTPTHGVTKDYENDDSNYDLANPIYRAGYRYAIQTMQYKMDAMKNEAFQAAIKLEEEINGNKK